MGAGMRYFSSVANFIKIFLLLFSFGLGSNSSVAADEMVSGAVIKSFIKNILDEKGLSSMPIISDNRMFRACKTPLNLRPMFGNFRTIMISCEDKGGFEIAVRTKAVPRSVIEPDQNVAKVDPVRKKILVLSRSVQKGEILEAADVRLSKRLHGRLSGFFTLPGDIVGRKTKVRLSEDQVILNRHLEIDWDIERGQEVIIESNIGPVSVFGAGIAMNNAQIGGLVKVQNRRSKLLVEGVAVSQKKINILTK